MIIKKTDANQLDLMKQCRKIPNLSIVSTHIIGKGFPDCIIGYKGKNYMIEIKDGNKPKSARKLTKDEIIFHEKWNGQVNIVENFDDIIKLIQ